MWLCGTCHRDVHRGPQQAQDDGFIVSAYVEDPGTIPLRTWYGLVTLDCHGFFNYVTEERSEF